MATSWVDKAPLCRPLDTPDELFSFDPLAVDAICKGSVPLAPQVQRAPGRPRLLACHDMRGGYLEDRLAQGGGNADFYYFRHWGAVDLFVYFSHRLVTIPPVGWVNAGHRHGVPVLGTLITEWEQGAQHCRQLFGSLAAAERTARQLAAVAQTYGFDGWVINIENEMEREHIPNLLHFLRVLTGLLRAASPCAEVVWYDAVTTEGELKWQNTLNDLNRPFFEASTALWVNYTWKEETPSQVRAAAGKRGADVFMGIDLFGRGTYGGGGFSCDVALLAARAQGLSAALFATAWPFDAEPAADDPHASWQERDEALWSIIAGAWGGHRPVCSRLPLYTDFGVGTGRATLYRGALLDPCAWYNLSRQGLQPSLLVQPAALPSDYLPMPQQPSSSNCSSSTGAGPEGTLQAVPSMAAAYSGGSCVQVTGEMPGGRQLVSLFSAAIPLPPGGLAVGYAAAACGSGVQPALVLTMAPAGEQQQQQQQLAEAVCVVLLPSGAASGSVQQELAQHASKPESVVLLNEAEGPGEAAEQERGPAADYQRQQGQPALPALPWVRRRYRLHPSDLPMPATPSCTASGSGGGSSGWELVSLDLLVLPERSSSGQLEPCKVEIYLGELWMEELGGSKEPCCVSALACSGLQLVPGPLGSPVPGSELAATLSWDCSAAVRCCHVYYSLEGGSNEQRRQWLGVASGASFRVHSVLVPPGCEGARFTVQPVAEYGGRLQPWGRAAQVAVELCTA